MRKKDKFIFYIGGLLAPYIFFVFWFLFGFAFFQIVPQILVFIELDLLRGKIPEFLDQSIINLSILVFLFAYPAISFILFRKISRFQIKKYIEKGGKLEPIKIINLSVIWWLFSLFFCFISLITISLSLYPVKTVPYDSIVKNVLVNGIKECIIRDVDNQTTRFGDVQSFSTNYSNNYSKFKIESLDPNSCYKAKALPTKGTDNTWFEIDLNNETGEVSKTCGDSSKPGCEEGNTW